MLKVNIDMKKILIGGDSWACGEWQFDKTNTNTIVHPGLAQYFLDDGFAVINCAQGRSSNSEAIDRMLDQYAKDKFDYVIWVQTDPLRDLRPYVDFLSKFTKHDQLLVESNRLLNSSYEKLNQLGKQIICLGGCSKLDPDISKYKNLIPLVDSIIEFLLPDFTHPEIWHSDWIRCTKNAVVSTFNEELLDQLLMNKQQQDQLYLEPLFNPDGQHPNRDGHRIIYDRITEFLIKGN